MKILIINGPNLNLLGKREPTIYGQISFENYLKNLKQEFKTITLDYFQSNEEGTLINRLQAADDEPELKGIILNAGGYSHTSVAITDAIAAISKPVIEVHISNIFARESFRHHSLLSANCVGIISGLGLKGYALALQYFLDR